MNRVVHIFVVLCATLSATLLSAQQNIGGHKGLNSVVVNNDASVTFSYHNPEAQSVAVKGDFITLRGETLGRIELSESEDGLWQGTTPPLASELYYYSFILNNNTELRDPASTYCLRDVGSLISYFVVPGGRGDLYVAQDVPHGTLARVWYSVDNNPARRMTVYTPAGYERGGRYPVLYLLHGMGGDEEAWVATGRLAEIMDNMIASGKAEPMIVVMTNGCMQHLAAPGYSSEGMWSPYMSGSMDGSFENHFGDVVTWIDRHYRTKAHRSSRAIAGLSMGGFHALHISQHYPKMFDYVALFSAAIFRGKEGVEIYEDLEAKLIRQFSYHPALYWIGIGNEDFLYEENVEFRALLDAHNLPYTYFESSGGHTWRNWRIYLTEIATRIFK